MKKYNFIDLFAGGGGLSEGFIRAGFTPVAHVEVVKDAALTLKTRMAYHFLKEEKQEKIYFDYIQHKITRDEFYKNIPENILDVVINREIQDLSFNDIKKQIRANLNGIEVDVLIGGPPCQAYSVIGRARDPNKKRNDPKNLLYKQYLKYLREFNPKLFIFENVPGLLTAGNSKYYNELMKLINRAGYSVEKKILDSADFGVLQYRKRVIIIGWKKEINYSYPEFIKSGNKFKIKDLFNDLPVLQKDRINNNYSGDINDCLVELKIRNENDILTQNFTREINKNDKEIYRIAISKWDIERKRLNYQEIPLKFKTHNNEQSFKDRFKVVDGDGLSHTMVAHISKDGHYYIYPDINQQRSLTVREAARIQSFPDNYYFEGSRTSVLAQIGNAVPVLMAEKIAMKILEYIK